MEADALRRLYEEEGLSLLGVAARTGLSVTQVWRRLVAAGVARREAISPQLFQREDFAGSERERAYLLGFRQGDLHVAAEGSGVTVKCTSTRAEQVALFRALFEAYGHVYTDEATIGGRVRQSVGMQVTLNRSFAFLLPKGDLVPEWVLVGHAADE